MRVLVTGLSEKNTREQNQDRFGSIVNRSGDLLLLLADGMGGHYNGGYCAEFSINYFTEEFSKSTTEEIEEETFEKWSKRVIDELRISMLKDSKTKKLNMDMGTTLVAAMLSNNTIDVLNIGDSRCYYGGRTFFRLLTKDQVVKNYPPIAHLMSPNALVSALGPQKQAIVDVTKASLRRGVVALTSDGVHGVLTDFTIRRIIMDTDYQLKDRAANLVKKALEKGSTDNITCLLVEL